MILEGIKNFHILIDKFHINKPDRDNISDEFKKLDIGPNTQIIGLHVRIQHVRLLKTLEKEFIPLQKCCQMCSRITLKLIGTMFRVIKKLARKSMSKTAPKILVKRILISSYVNNNQTLNMQGGGTPSNVP